MIAEWVDCHFMARPRQHREIDDRIRQYVHALELRAIGRHGVDLDRLLDAAVRSMLAEPAWHASTRVLLRVAESSRSYAEIAAEAEQLGLQPPGRRAPWSHKVAERAAHAARAELQRRLDHAESAAA